MVEGKKVKNISTSSSDSQQVNTFFFVNENDQIEFVSTENQAKTLTDSLQQDATIQHFQKNNTLKSNNNTSSENFSESEWNKSDEKRIISLYLKAILSLYLKIIYPSISFSNLYCFFFSYYV